MKIKVFYKSGIVRTINVEWFDVTEEGLIFKPTQEGIAAVKIKWDVIDTIEGAKPM